MPTVVDNKRIAKNTFFLYIRTIVSMLISLYTSRVILQILGVDDFGIYQVIGGLVAMFSIISSSLTTGISRFITFEIGTGNIEKLKKIFATSVLSLIAISIVIIIGAEFIAGWFIEKKMVVPSEKVTPTMWVLQFTLITFVINLISLPYNACIIAHEHMKAFAYIGLIEVILKLGACFLLLVIPLNKLVTYAALLTLIAVVIRLIYNFYCTRHFEEARAKLRFDKSLFKEIMSFSGMTLLTNTTFILNNQGVTMLINVFFGLVVNTARGLAGQVQAAITSFVNNFTTALNPQITKSYANGELEAMYALICRGAKFASYAMLFISLPIFLEMEPILKFWLGKVPEDTVIFAQLSLILGFLDCMSTTGYVACMASGKIKSYTIVLTLIGVLEFGLTWLFFKLGAPAVAAYWIFIGVTFILNIARAVFMKILVGMPLIDYFKHVYLPVGTVIIASLILPLIVHEYITHETLRLIFTIFVSFISVIFCSYLFGLSATEKKTIKEKFLIPLTNKIIK